MSNYKTGAQRYNDRMDKIWDTAKKNGAFSDDNLKKARAHEETSRARKKEVAKKMKNGYKGTGFERGEEFH